MSIIRNKLTRKFTTIPNQIITDHNLSSGALRVYLYLLSKPDGWKVVNFDIQEQLNIKQAQTLANFWKELINLGWISRCRMRDKDNRIIGGYDYELNENPVLPDYNVDEATLGNVHNMEKPYYGKPINRENPQYINNTKEQEQSKTDLNNTYSPTPLSCKNKAKANTGGVNAWLDQVKQFGYQFTDKQIQAIGAWAQYKAEKKEHVTLQQIELMLKQLNGYVFAKQDIVYLIENSIARGYKGIMEPTKNSINPVSPPLKRYSSDEYIIPENPAQKIELRDYIMRCYMFDKLDPRTKEPLTKEQISLLRKHFQIRDKRRMSYTDYIHQEEVLTGICLLEQPIAT